jgi:hypothetical protein
MPFLLALLLHLRRLAGTSDSRLPLYTHAVMTAIQRGAVLLDLPPETILHIRKSCWSCSLFISTSYNGQA